MQLGGEPIKGSDYFSLGRVTEFKYGKFLGEAFRGQNQLKYLNNFGNLNNPRLSYQSSQHFNSQQCSYLHLMFGAIFINQIGNVFTGEGWGMYPDGNALVFLDNHDNQRGHGAGGASVLTFRVSRMYKMAMAFMQAWPYGIPRVMSSYFWEQDIQNGQDKNDWVLR